jgi:hypothetical protein
MDGRSQLDEDSTGASDNPGSAREARLLRLVDIMRAEQIRASVEQGAEAGGSGFHWRRPWPVGGLVLIAAGVVGATLAGAVLLHSTGPSGGRRRAASVDTAMVEPAPVASAQRTPAADPVQPQPPPGAGEADAVADKPGGPGAGAGTSNAPDRSQAAEPPEVAAAPTQAAPVTTPPQPIAPTVPQVEAEPAAPGREAEPAAPQQETAPAAAQGETASAAPPGETEPAAPRQESEPAAPGQETASAAPQQETASAAPGQETASAAPGQETASAAPGREAAASGTSPAGSPVAGPPPATATAEVPDPEAARPVLLVYYPDGSVPAEAAARSLTTRIGSNFVNSDVNAETSPPDTAVIRFSEQRNHSLARIVGKSLGDAGYRWRIENTAGSGASQRNTIEVWLPGK